jgi:copper/silver efflux system protein
MLTRLIDFSLKNKFLVLFATLGLVVGGIYAVKHTPVDAIPDLSDVQVIVYTEWDGQAPSIVQDQVTYPITTKMLSVPYAKTVRGYSFYGFSFVYVIFEDGTDPYWARSRVLEYLNGLGGQLPKGVTPTLGPDATGVGWAFMYSLESDKRDLQELRSLQDWHLKYQLTAVDGVSEVASVGGFVKQYQVTVDPVKLRAYNLPLSMVEMAIKRSSGEVGGRALEMSEKEFILRVKGYIDNVEQLRQTAVSVGENGVPILLRDVATVQLGPDMRRGIAERNGEGETVGGIVVVRYGANARQVIADVKKALAEAMKAYPDVKVNVAYDRSTLIDRAVKTLEEKLIEESIVVALVCLLFLMHFRSALVAILILPTAVLMSFLVMHQQGLSSNIMSLGGIAIAIGAMVDAAIIMIENAHKHLEHDAGKKPHWQIIRDASIEVGPTLFYSLLVITVSFLPVFTLQEQEGRLFKPLAFTKTYSMAAAALLSVTLAPILMGFFIRGKIPAEEKNPINRFLIHVYHPLLDWVIRWRWSVVIGAALIVAQIFFPWNKLVVKPLENWAVAASSNRPLTLALSRGERENPAPSNGMSSGGIRTGDVVVTKDSQSLSPLPGGEGQGEGGRDKLGVSPTALATQPLTRPSATLSPSDGVRGDSDHSWRHSLASAAASLSPLFPFQNIGSEFMPPLYEGDLLYMPTTFPGVSATKARELLQQTDKLIKSFPEVKNVFGKIGRAETATDPAPMDMIETTIMLKPEHEWPAVDIKDENGQVVAHRRRTQDELVDALNSAVQFPGLANAWTMPIKTRIDMLSTGIKTPVGIKIAGPDLAELERIAVQVESVVRTVPGTTSAYAERVMGGTYIEFDINREAIARYGLNLADVQDVLAVALGGMPITTTVEGLERYTINLRYDRDFRSNLDALKNDIVIPTPTGAQVPLGELATLRIVNAPMAIKSEASVPNAWLYVDIRDVDVGTYVANAKRVVEDAIAKGTIQLPTGYNLFWSGQYEYMMRAKERLSVVVPLTLLIIVLIIYLNTKSPIKTAIVLLAVPFSLVGAFWMIYLSGYNLSVAVWVGLIALAGLDAETGVVMLLYLDLAYDEWKKKGLLTNLTGLRDAIYHGAVKRVRPKAMTAAVIIAGLLPILWSHGAGADVMKRIATPMVGGVVTSTLMELMVYPAIFFLWRKHTLKKEGVGSVL